jgi:hypothetical protein
MLNLQTTCRRLSVTDVEMTYKFTVTLLKRPFIFWVNLTQNIIIGIYWWMYIYKFGVAPENCYFSKSKPCDKAICNPIIIFMESIDEVYIENSLRTFRTFLQYVHQLFCLNAIGAFLIKDSCTASNKSSL